MAHHIYHTRGIILGSRETGESNIFYRIFTEDMGLVGAAATSVREVKSKLRYALQDLSLVSVDLVRGKEIWRITSASPSQSWAEIKKDPAKSKLFFRICTLLSRLLQGEGREDALFSDVILAAQFLEEEKIPQQLLPALETLTTTRMLARLGYFDSNGYEAFVTSGEYSIGSLEAFNTVHLTALSRINEALEASHL